MTVHSLTSRHFADSPDTDITESYAAASSFMSRVEKVKGRVLVHCVSGKVEGRLIFTHDVLTSVAYTCIFFRVSDDELGALYV
jgi:hypothetical protein